MWPIWFQIIGWPLGFLIATGNGLVIYLIISRPKLRTVTNWFVLSLAAADFGAVIIFPALLSPGCDFDQPCSSYVATYVAYSAGVCFFYTSALSLCTLTLDRYLAIVRPFRYITFMTTRRIASLISVAWCVPIVIVLIPLLTLEFAMSPGISHDNLERYLWLLLGGLNILICISLLFTTARILLVARKHSRQNAAVVKQLNYNHATTCKARKSQESAATKLIGTLVLVFVICYSLHTVDFFCFLKLCTRTVILPSVNILLIMVNSAANPLVYAFFKREIRGELRQLCPWKRMQNSEECAPFHQQM